MQGRYCPFSGQLLLVQSACGAVCTWDIMSRYSPNANSKGRWPQVERVPTPSLLIVYKREMAKAPTTSVMHAAPPVLEVAANAAVFGQDNADTGCFDADAVVAQ